MKKFEKNLFIFSILMIINFVIFRNLSYVDELFNYNFGRNIIHGNVLYVDFNAIIFPLFPYIIALFLKVFGEELIVYRFLEMLIFVGILYFSFKLLKKLKLNNKIKNYIIICVYIGLMSSVYPAEYNLFCILLALIILNIESFGKEYKIFNNILIGIIAGLCITIKQSTGVLIAISSIFSVLCKENTVKDKIKYILLRIIRNS